MQIQHTGTGSTHLVTSGLGVASSLIKPRAALANAAASASAGSGNSSTAAARGASTITANDFLTLLVAEMKNQDPTTPTDPAQYITQMVNVNSLQQLIGINQGISSLDLAAGAPPASSGAAPAAAAATAADAQAANAIDSLANGASNTSSGPVGLPTWLSALGSK